MTLVNVITRDVYAARGPRGVYWSVLLDASNIVKKWGEYKHCYSCFGASCPKMLSEQKSCWCYGTLDVYKLCEPCQCQAIHFLGLMQVKMLPKYLLCKNASNCNEKVM